MESNFRVSIRIKFQVSDGWFGRMVGAFLELQSNEENEIQIHSLKPTAKAPENRAIPGPKRKRENIFQPSIFRCELAVSFREGILW